MSKKYTYVHVWLKWTDNFDTVCSRCKQRFGAHFSLTCPDKKGYFSKQVRKPLKTIEAKKLHVRNL